MADLHYYLAALLLRVKGGLRYCEMAKWAYLSRACTGTGDTDGHRAGNASEPAGDTSALALAVLWQMPHLPIPYQRAP